MSRKRQLVVAILALSSILLVWSLSIAASKVIGPVEQKIFYSINGWSNVLRIPFLFITYTATVYAVALTVLFLIWRGYPRVALRVFSACGVVFVLTQAIKYMVERPRPAFILSDAMVREKLVAGYGYPSTHTAIATVMALILAVFLPQKWKWLAILWIVLVGISRIYLGVHAPLDIVGGAAVGVMVICLSLLVSNKLKVVRKITRLKLSD